MNHYFISEPLLNNVTYVFVVNDGFVNLFKRQFRDYRSSFCTWNKVSSCKQDFNLGPDVTIYSVIHVACASDLFSQHVQDVILGLVLSSYGHKGPLELKPHIHSPFDQGLDISTEK